MTDPLHDPLFFRDPYSTYDRLRSASPVQKIPTGSRGHHAYLVTGHAEARQAFTDPRLSKDAARFFAGRPSGRDLHPAVARNMLASDPPGHTRQRAAAAPLFTTGPVGGMRPYISQVVDRLLDGWAQGAEVDLVKGLAVPLPVTVICQLLGVPESDRDMVSRWSNDLFDADDPDIIDAASHAVGEYMTDLVGAARDTPGEGVLPALFQRGEAGLLDEDDVTSLAVLLLVAGHETTTHFIGNSVLALLQHPSSLARLRRDPGLIAGSLDELLRYDSPVGIATFRYSTEALELGGVEIPAGFPVLIAPGAANRDPLPFADPQRLDLDRNAGGHLAFGHGIHRCLGAPLARAEAEIALRALVTRFPGLRLAVPEEELEWRRTRLTRGLRSLPVVL
ncbi:cytochrome P450 family protein [Streptomyces sp. NBC_00539]|uniref:cytochrome P450 family protein n=1 Tax=Streptomyces sp. NBC_00539 TaxID=2975770 RepID=UPI002E80C7DC|nr:cytochrome P450 [Streptomyces sp. NBC_00539]WUC64217.1 cytochrome P450 [Streptomyces sp. NBC_00539]